MTLRIIHPKPVVYFRKGAWTDGDEWEACARHLPTVYQRTQIPPGSLVIPRYSALPFYQELERDAHILGSTLINSYEQHSYVADIRKYFPDLDGITPRTWDMWGNLPEGQYIVKGTTNSRKHEWRTRMFCACKADIPRVVSSLLDDDLLCSQSLVVREYVPLKTFGLGINDLPITNEWRFFVLGRQILCAGWYWASEPDWGPPEPMSPPVEATRLVQEAINRVGDRVQFFVVDVAETAAGPWIVIELNDGQQSGLSMIDPDVFYSKLAEALQ